MHIVYRLKYEDRNLEPIDNYDVFGDEVAALDAFSRALTEPDCDLGSVYLTVDDGNDEHVIASTYLR